MSDAGGWVEVLTMRRPRWRASTIERYRDGHLGDFIAAAEGQEQ